MRILQLYSGQNTSTGDFVYRVAQTARGLNELTGVEVVNRDLVSIGHVETLAAAPLLILHHISDPDLLPVIRERQKRGRPTVYELADNFLASNEHLPEALQTGPPEYHLVIKELMRRCEAVQVNNPRLAALAEPNNRKCILLPNVVQEQHFGSPHRPDSKVLRIGWGGSDRHFADIEAVAKPLSAWLRATKGVKLVIQSSERIHQLFNKLPPEKVQLRSPGSLQAYLSFLDEIDVGLAPLISGNFNACRSSIKLLEYASRGVAPLCSRYAPYLEAAESFPGLPLFGDAEEMIGWLRRFRADRGVRQRVAVAAWEWARSRYKAEESHWKRLVREYEKLFLASGLNASPARDRQLQLLNESAVTVVNEALTASDVNQTLSALRQAIRGSFRNYQLHYFYAWGLSRAGKYEQAARQLEQALQLNPDSVRSLQLLARIQLISQDIEGAQSTIERALEVESRLATTVNLKAVILQAQGRHRAAFRTLRECLRAEPDYVDARINFARSALKIGEYFEAEISLQRLCRLVPESAQTHYLLALLADKQGNYDLARRHARRAANLDPTHLPSQAILRQLSPALAS